MGEPHDNLANLTSRRLNYEDVGVVGVHRSDPVWTFTAGIDYKDKKVFNAFAAEGRGTGNTPPPPLPPPPIKVLHQQLKTGRWRGVYVGLLLTYRLRSRFRTERLQFHFNANYKPISFWGFYTFGDGTR